MKKFLLSSTLIATTLLVTALFFINSGKAWSDDDDDDDEKWSLFGSSSIEYSENMQASNMQVNNAMYKEECGSCHMAYPPGLLPADSWKKVMLNLENHFGDNAELEAPTDKKLLNYLIANSADSSENYRSNKIVHALNSSSIIDRITLTPYFIRKHDEIPKRFVVKNPDVGSFSQCDSCHLNAKNGSFNEDEVRIPGVGAWED